MTRAVSKWVHQFITILRSWSITIIPLLVSYLLFIFYRVSSFILLYILHSTLHFTPIHISLYSFYLRNRLTLSRFYQTESTSCLYLLPYPVYLFSSSWLSYLPTAGLLYSVLIWVDFIRLRLSTHSTFAYRNHMLCLSGNRTVRKLYVVLSLSHHVSRLRFL